jgi:LysM repeat protein
MLVAVITSACYKPFSTPVAATNTPMDQSLFATPMEQATSMSDIELFGTGTAIALTGLPVGGATQTPSIPVIGTQDILVTLTPTPLVALNPTATLAVSGTLSGPLPTSMPVGSRPASYTLQKGEFVFCIARRFDVDPDQMLALNGLVDSETVYPGTVLKIPQSGSFPDARALKNHPATYTVSSSDETIYSVACLFGDVDPGALAQANNISAGAALTSGQQLNIP